MLKNLKTLNKRGLQLSLPRYSSLIVLNNTLARNTWKIQPQLHFEITMSFSNGNQGPEFVANEEKIWVSPEPLVFSNGELKLYSALRSNYMLYANVILYSILGSIGLFSGSKLYDYKNRSWFGALFYFGLTTSALRGMFSVMNTTKMVVIEASLLSDGKHMKMATRKFGLKPTWETVEINKIQKLPHSGMGFGYVFLVDGNMYIMPAIGDYPNPEVLSAVIDGFNIETSDSQEEIVIN